MENVARTCALHVLKPVADAKSTGVEDKRISAHGFAPSSDQAMDERVSILIHMVYGSGVWKFVFCDSSSVLC